MCWSEVRSISEQKAPVGKRPFCALQYFSDPLLHIKANDEPMTVKISMF